MEALKEKFEERVEQQIEINKLKAEGRLTESELNSPMFGNNQSPGIKGRNSINIDL